jgi:hypothetical protein
MAGVTLGLLCYGTPSTAHQLCRRQLGVAGVTQGQNHLIINKKNTTNDNKQQQQQ